MVCRGTCEAASDFSMKVLSWGADVSCPESYFIYCDWWFCILSFFKKSILNRALFHAILNNFSTI